MSCPVLDAESVKGAASNSRSAPNTQTKDHRRRIRTQMNDQEYAELSTDQIEQIDELCVEFEGALASGQRLSIETCLKRAGASLQPTLFRELLETLLTFQRRSGQPVAAAEFLNRFLTYTAIVEDVFAGLPDMVSSEATVTIENFDTESLELPHAESEAPADDSPLDETIVTPKFRPAEASGQSSVELPCRFGRYELRQLLGQGGMGSVYLAYDPDLDRKIAIKFPGFEDRPDIRKIAIERFRREARSMATLHHPHLCPVYDVGEIDGQHYLTMAYVEGQSLTGASLSQADAVRVVAMTARAVQAAHDEGIIHRDLKPSNILLNAKGEPVVMDFGLASRDAVAEAELTHSGVIIGSPAYMAPEQVEAAHDKIGPQTDVYALGVILYQLLTDRRPFEGAGLSVLGQISSGERPAPPSQIAAVSPSLEAVCLKAMAHDRGDRFQSAAELAEALDRALADSDEVGSAEKLRPRTSRTRRTRFAAIGLALLAVAAVAFSVVRIQTPYGEVIVEAAKDANIEVEVEQDGNVVAVLGPDNDWQVRVEAGKYQLKLRGGDHQLSLKDDTVVVSKDEQTLVTISQTKTPPQVAQIVRPNYVRNTGGALEFDGSRSYVDIPTLSRSGNEPLTMEAWVRPAKMRAVGVIAKLSGDSVLQLTAAAKGDTFTAIDKDWRLSRADALPNLKPEVLRYVPDQWAHIAIVSGSNDVRLFVNGVQAWSHRQVAMKDETEPKGLWLGAHPHEERMEFHFRGWMDEFLLSSTARYTGNFEPNVSFESDDQTLALYHFDEGQGDRLEDASGNDHHGTIASARWVNLEQPETSSPRTFADSGQLLGGSLSTRVLMADLDDDGDQDAFVANYKAPDTVWWNDGKGVFTDSGQRLGNSRSHSAALGDLDGDGDLDVFIGNVNGEPNAVYINEGRGVFQDSGQSLGTSGTKDIVLRDFDADGDLDAVVANYWYGKANRVYLNDGKGMFTDSGQALGDFSSYGVAADDLDNDGDEDLFVFNGGEDKFEPNCVYLNDGQGNFENTDQLLGGSCSEVGALFDVDGDGDLDAVAANMGFNRVWLNDGKANFTDSGQLFDTEISISIVPGDVDQDGHPDIITCNKGVSAIWRNDGKGVFSNPQRLLDDSKTFHAALADLDGDGDLDIFAAINGPNRILLNTASIGPEER